MTVLYLEALAGIALSLSIPMAIAWVVHQCTGNSGCVDAIWAFSVGRVAALMAIWQMLRSRGARPHDCQSRTSMFFPLPPQKGVVI